VSKPRLKKDFQAAAANLGLPTAGTIPQISQRIAKLGYNCATGKSRRQSPQTRVRHESKVMTAKVAKRTKATTQDQNRNLALVAWAVRNHIDYTSSFKFSFRTDNDPLNKLVNSIFKWHGRPQNFDVAGRLGREESFRLYEMEKVISGDVGLIKLEGLKLQGLESDLIAKGSGAPEDVNEQGLIVKDNGERVSFSVCNRGPKNNSLVFDRLVDADAVLFDGYWSRLTSQFRGISPLTTAINMVQDIHEGFEFNLIKGKMQALFGIAITRNPGGEDGFGGAGGSLTETAPPQTASDGETELDLSPDAINILDMNPGEAVDTIESKTPSSEQVDGWYLFIQIALLALDIPVTFFDSRRSSFSGGVADLNKYEKACEWKRDKNRYVRHDYSNWILEEIWNNEDDADVWNLKATAIAAGVTTLRQLQELLEWIPSGSPWMDKLKQIKGDDIAIELRVDNALDASRRRGTDVFDNIDKQLMVEQYEMKKRADMGLPERVSGDPLKYDADLFDEDGNVKEEEEPNEQKPA